MPRGTNEYITFDKINQERKRQEKADTMSGIKGDITTDVSEKKKGYY